MSNVHPLEAVSSGSETQLQVVSVVDHKDFFRIFYFLA